MERYRQQIQELDGLGFPGKTFAGAVLKPVFDTQRDYYYKAFIEISLAHALMLHEQGILAKEEAKPITEVQAEAVPLPAQAEEEDYSAYMDISAFEHDAVAKI